MRNLQLDVRFEIVSTNFRKAFGQGSSLRTQTTFFAIALQNFSCSYPSTSGRRPMGPYFIISPQPKILQNHTNNVDVDNKNHVPWKRQNYVSHTGYFIEFALLRIHIKFSTPKPLQYLMNLQFLYCSVCQQWLSAFQGRAAVLGCSPVFGSESNVDAYGIEWETKICHPGLRSIGGTVVTL